ncbi:MAG TPA: CapA family protein [candidate division Zixibacteria bacterium]|nr:CapA family protein [candidate division Zixibacteria bacterium]
MTIHKVNSLRRRSHLILVLLVSVLVACTDDQSLESTPSASITVIATADMPSSTQTVPPPDRILPTLFPTVLSPTTQPTPTTKPPVGISVRGSVPASLVYKALVITQEHGDQYAWNAVQEESSRSIAIQAGEGFPLAEWVYAVAAPFATVTDRTTIEEVVMGWQTGSSPVGKLILASTTAETFSSIWGAPSGEPSPSVLIVEDEYLMDSLWANRPSWTLVPFDELVPSLKVLKVDGQSPFDRLFDLDSYPLTIPIGIAGDENAVSAFMRLWGDRDTNHDPARITRVAMSGVTALGRATAYQMEIRGITTPGEVVGPVLREADIAHISHEVSFSAECPYPDPIGDPIFCAKDEYLELLISIGADVVELTGNHVNDWGPENTSRSVDLYEEAGMKTFGGGRNLNEANQPALFEHNGNMIAFVGCNPVGPPGAWATDFRAGSSPCDYEAFYNQIQDLRDAGYVVIATLQYPEFYQYAPTIQQIADFREVVVAGANAVSGSQGHHAQGFDFYDGAFIHFGLGNLFFDQMDMLGTRQSFIDTYIIYDGELIGVELFTSLIENYCCPRAMTTDERSGLLESAFQASGW